MRSDAADRATVGLYTIGQTPRPDLVEPFERRFPEVEFTVTGALDDIPAGDLTGVVTPRYPLETTLASGARVVVDVEFVEPHLQRAIDRHGRSLTAHFLLCAGPFSKLHAPEPLICPDRVGTAELARLGFTSLELVVPFGAQTAPALDKWMAAGFTGRAHDLEALPRGVSLARWLAHRLEHSDADAVVFDYVGFPAKLLDAVAVHVELPVFDLGHIAMDALEKVLDSR